jgi:L-methionine (R)-S-oxide reductase
MDPLRSSVRHFLLTGRGVYSEPFQIFPSGEWKTYPSLSAGRQKWREDAMKQHAELLAGFERFARSGATADTLMQNISDRLHEQLVRYNWVGFYLIDKDDKSVLVLGPYAGTETPHQRIPLNQGLCGAAASMRKTIVVNDVASDPRYLMGSEHTKSEIIVPVVVRDAIAGELDINSYFKDTWDAKEQQFVEKCAALVGKNL